MKIPKSIEILGNKWKIVQCKEFIEYEGTKNYGLCFYSDRVIKIYVESDSKSTNETLLHELGHALIYELGLTVTSLNHDINEAIVEGYSRFLVKHFKLSFK